MVMLKLSHSSSICIFSFTSVRISDSGGNISDITHSKQNVIAERLAALFPIWEVPR
jgi:hypothetical protein